MGKGGCKSSAVKEKVMPAKESNNNKGGATLLEKERQEKINAEPKFYWAHDEEPHRRR
jgi:hypothetical protein